MCRLCAKELPLSEFWKSGRTPDGLAKDCKACSKAQWKKRVTPEQRVKYNERGKRFDDFNIQRYLLRYAKKRAKEKSLECTIRASDIPLREFCPILGVQLVKNRGQWAGNSYSLDRVDSTKGYVPGNVQVISWQANNLKSNLSVEQVERLLAYMKGELDPPKENI